MLHIIHITDVYPETCMFTINLKGEFSQPIRNKRNSLINSGEKPGSDFNLLAKARLPLSWIER